MSLETDEQIAAKIQRQKDVQTAWRKFRAQAQRDPKLRRRLKKLPPTGIYHHDPGT